MTDILWILLTASLVASSCAVVGCFLILRRLAMLGDAISHSILLGIVLAFMLTGSRNTIPMLIGAGVLGMLTAFLTDVLNRWGKLPSDAAIGVTFTWLFAIGVILIAKYTEHVDLDTDCVLYGEIILGPFDRLEMFGLDIGPRPTWILGIITIANLFFVGLGYKHLKICAFDPILAASLGINVALWHYLLMGFVSVTAVGAFESVGAIIVVAMLIVPPNTAYLLTDRLSRMIALAAFFGIASAISGFYLAMWVDGSPAGGIATMSGVFFLIAAAFSPRHGALGKLLAQVRARRAVAAGMPELP
jgi:manganese/zinc/iron transport system permease protein